MKSKWAKWLTPVVLLLTLLPLLGTGLILAGLSFRDLRESARIKQHEAITNVGQVIRQNILLLQRQSEDLMFSVSRIKDPLAQRKYLSGWLKRNSSFLSLQHLSGEGIMRARIRRQGQLKWPEIPLNQTARRGLMITDGVWRDRAFTPAEGKPRLTILVGKAPDTVYPGGLLMAEVDLSFLSSVLRPHLQSFHIFEEGHLLADGQDLQTSFPSSTTRPSSQGFSATLPDLGWTLTPKKSPGEFYRPVWILLIQFGVAIVVVGGLSGSIGVIVSRRAKKSIAHQESLSLLGQMSGTIGHEIRTGLAVIKNAAEAIKEDLDSLSPHQAKQFNLLERQIAASHKIVVDILHLSRKGDHRPSPVAVNDIVRATLEEIPDVRNRAVKVNLHQNLPPVALDVDDFKGALKNVLINSFEATEPGGEIFIQTSRRNGEVSVVVKDTGSGMHPRVRKNVTEPFFSTKTHGTGLGLAVVKRFVDHQAGHLIIDSEPGKGTTVQMVLVTSS